MPGVIGASAVIVAALGLFPDSGRARSAGRHQFAVAAVRDCESVAGRRSLYASRTTILVKMHGAKFMWITCVPLIGLVIVTFTAACQKIWSPLPRIGFLAQAAQLEATGSAAANIRAQIFNNRLDAVVCGAFMLLVAIILLDSMRLWFGIIRGTADNRVAESPFVPTQLNPEEA